LHRNLTCEDCVFGDFLEEQETMFLSELFLTQKVFLENVFLQIFNMILCLLHLKSAYLIDFRALASFSTFSRRLRR
jgi:hypothetical protein